MERRKKEGKNQNKNKKVKKEIEYTESKIEFAYFKDK